MSFEKIATTIIFLFSLPIFLNLFFVCFVHSGNFVTVNLNFVNKNK